MNQVFVCEWLMNLELGLPTETLKRGEGINSAPAFAGSSGQCTKYTVSKCKIIGKGRDEVATISCSSDIQDIPLPYLPFHHWPCLWLFQETKSSETDTRSCSWHQYSSLPACPWHYFPSSCQRWNHVLFIKGQVLHMWSIKSIL